MKKKQKEINEKILDELEFGFSCERAEHLGWREQKKLKDYYNKIEKDTGFQLSQMFGRWQYFYRSTRGTISLVRLRLFMFNENRRKWVWEIYSYENLFNDVQRFKTKKEAVKVIKSYLCQTI